MEAGKFLAALTKALTAMQLYGAQHPERQKAVALAHESLHRLLEVDPRPRFTFIGADAIYNDLPLRSLRHWDWAPRFAKVGVQRIEIDPDTTPEDLEAFLQALHDLLFHVTADSSVKSHLRRSTIRWGAVGLRDEGYQQRPVKSDGSSVSVPRAFIPLQEEGEAIRFIHEAVQGSGQIPLLEAESVVRSLSAAMHGSTDVVLPLLTLKQFDQYTTTHSINVAVLTMALTEWMGRGSADVRAFGMAALLHDIGKVRVPAEVLVKPGRLTDEELALIRRHPADGARIIYESDKRLDLAAAVAYEHHMWIDGRGYPHRLFSRGCHVGSLIVHVCDVYDALASKRPYRDAMAQERILSIIEQGAGVEFDADAALAFLSMMRNWESRPATIDESSSLPSLTPIS
jgi:putative nucleotidyltransferase with HDIG domain